MGSTQMQKKIIGVPLQKEMQKTPEGFLLVRGKFTSDAQDEVGDVITREATARALPKYRQWGNIRRMHQPEPVGRVTRIGVEDGLAWNEVEILVIDPKAVFEVENGLLKALSVGILVNPNDMEKTRAGGLVINDYQLAEISLVDHPANYDAVLNLSLDEKTRTLIREQGLIPALRSLGISIEGVSKDMEPEQLEQEPLNEDVQIPVEQLEQAPVTADVPVEVAEPVEVPVEPEAVSEETISSEAELPAEQEVPAEQEPEPVMEPEQIQPEVLSELTAVEASLEPNTGKDMGDAPMAVAGAGEEGPAEYDFKAEVELLNQKLDQLTQLCQSMGEQMTKMVDDMRDGKALPADSLQMTENDPKVVAEKALVAEGQVGQDEETPDDEVMVEQVKDLQAQIAELSTPAERKGQLPTEDLPLEQSQEEVREDYRAMNLHDAVKKFIETRH